MTESERIIRQGILPESFLKREERNDFLITENRKKLWAILLDLLLKFDEVCKKHNLKYFLNSGSLLGAIRHKGFIPWDDDIDVEMPREDYEKLLKLSVEFEQPYFLQTPYTDPNSAYSFAKLRNSNTTMASKHFAFQEMNHGVLIDIFPYDKWDPEDCNSYNVIKFLASENSVYMRKTNPFLNEIDKKRVQVWSGIDPVHCFEITNKIAQKYKNYDTKQIIVAVCAIAKYEKKLKHLDDYSEQVMVEFEGFEFPIPVGYERVLTNLYGNYMEFPPVEKRGVWHDDLLIDVDTPYTEYLLQYKKQLSEGGI